MIFEEICQLGFKHDDPYPQNPDTVYVSDDDQQENSDLVSNAALKMNFDKKIKFADQLEFKLKDHVPFQNEELQPIVIENRQVKTHKRPKTAKKKKNAFPMVAKKANKEKKKQIVQNGEWN